ncbi:MAG: hypothetical protein ACXACP_11225 [Candidatus Hodarchaeales archaeon]|jgi:hypothetical protein
MGDRSITTRNSLQNAIVIAGDSQYRIKIEAPDTPNVATKSERFAFVWGLNSIRLGSDQLSINLLWRKKVKTGWIYQK